jgi:hypothetical protein
MKTRIVMTLILLGFLSQNNAYSSDDVSTHFKIKLKLNPKSQHIYVNVNLRLNPDKPLPDTLNFSLHKQFTLLKVTVKGSHDFMFDKEAPPVSVFMREARPLTITLDKNINRNKSLDIVFEYEGTITEWPENSANVVTEDWVELGMYLPWFPSGFICGYFTYEIEAECDPAYQLRSYGSYTKTNGTWHFEQTIPTFDIILVASKSLKTMERESGSYRVFFHYESLQDKTAEYLSNDLANILDDYAAWFGEDKKGEIFTVIQSPRDQGGDYARKGLIVLSGLTDEKYVAQHERFVRNLGHETAHFWWNMAPANSWEDWLNESFAEYSALLIIRKMFGTEAYNKWIADKNAAVKNIPPIWGFDRSNMQASEGPDIIEANLYGKGPLLLHQLSSRIGDEAFKLLCHEMVRTSVSSTDSFLSLLEKNHGSKTRTWFEDLLKSY